MNIAATCEWLQRCGLHWVPVPFGSKTPIEKRWQEPKIRPIPTDATNIGLLLVEGSGIIDIDLDNSIAVKIAEVLVEPTQGIARYGRASKQVSHILVRQTAPYAGPRRLVDPDARKLILEVRTDKQQSLIPPSIHPSGEVLKWVDDPCNLEHTTNDVAETIVRWVGAATILAMGWEPGIRHHLALAIAGWLLRQNVPQDRIERLITAICRAVNDAETRDRITAIIGTAARQDQPTTGLPTIKTLIGEKRAEIASNLLFPKHTAKKTKSLTVEKILCALSERDDIKILSTIDKDNALVWTGTKWQKGSLGLIRPIVVQTLEKLNADERWYNHVVTLCTYLVRGAVHELMIDETDLDHNPYLLGFPNGEVIDLQTGKIRPANRSDMITRSTSVDYDPYADRSLFLDTLIAASNRETVEYLQLLAGATLVGHPAKLIVIIYGGTDTGKTLFLVDSLCLALGDYAIQLDPAKVMRAGADRQELWLSRAIGKRLVVLSEPSQGYRIDTALLKSITGRGTVTIRQLYSQPKEVVPTWTFWIDTNWKPSIDDVDEAVWSRIRSVEFTTKIKPPPTSEKYDPNFLEKWRQVAPRACLAWAIEGALELVRQNIDVASLSRPEIDITSEWREIETEDSPIEFITERIEPDPCGFLPRKRVWEMYSEWVTERPQTRVVGKTELYEIMGKMYRLIKLDGEWGFRARERTRNREGNDDLETFPHSLVKWE